jgi:retron-type reverse transcriptase
MTQVHDSAQAIVSQRFAANEVLSHRQFCRANTPLKHSYVREGDRKRSFDTVHPRKLLSILKRRIADRDLLDLIWKFLQAGVMDPGLFARTERGLPPGAIRSPCLSHVYRNECAQWAATQWDRSLYARHKRRHAGLGHYKMVRFADGTPVQA